MVLKLPEILTEEDFIKILKHTKKDYHKLAFMLGFYECMRISEIIKLNPEDVNKQLKLLHIKQAKGHKDRNIPIAPEVIKGLKHLPIKCKIRALQTAFKNIIKELGLNPKFHFHTLRHSGITHYLTKKKWNSLEVQRLAGHSKIATTQIYTHIREEDLINRMWEK